MTIQLGQITNLQFRYGDIALLDPKPLKCLLLITQIRKALIKIRAEMKPAPTTQVSSS